MRRRAATSVAANAACPDLETAEKIVNEVWESCFNDTRPFDEVFLLQQLFGLSLIISGADLLNLERFGTTFRVIHCRCRIP